MKKLTLRAHCKNKQRIVGSWPEWKKNVMAWVKRSSVIMAFFLLTGCVISASGFKTDNEFFMIVKDKAGNEISTGATVNDPEYISELKEMYVKLVNTLEKILKENKL